MSESTESTNETNPFTKPGFIIAAALVVALIAATLVIFLIIPNGNEEATPQPSQASTGSASPTPTATAAGKSICGLVGSTATALGSAPKTTWSLVGRMAAPTDPKTHGPGITDADGFRSCFAQSPTGALYAAVNIVALGSSSQSAVKIAENLLVPGPGRDAAITDARNTPSSAPGSQSAQIKGFILKAYSPSEADVDLAIQLDTGALAHTVISLRWVGGDWKIKAADDGEIFTGTAQISDLGSFITWSGV